MSLIDLINAAAKREEQRIAYWYEVRRQQIAAKRQQEIADLTAIVGYNFGDTIGRDLGLTYSWCNDRAAVLFEHNGQTYTISKNGSNWMLGQISDLERFGDAGEINNRDIEPEQQQQRYDRLLIAIGYAIETNKQQQ